MLINDIECITLAHGITEDEVATHPFYGTERIVNSMKKRASSSSSKSELESELQFEVQLPEYVDLHEGEMIKDSQSGLVCGFEENLNEY